MYRCLSVWVLEFSRNWGRGRRCRLKVQAGDEIKATDFGADPPIADSTHSRTSISKLHVFVE
jgi:hypothetical protein